MDLYKFHKRPDSLDHYADAHEFVPELAWDKYKEDQEELRKREAIWATAACQACGYAVYVLEGPFPKGEAAIAKNPWYAYMYADIALKAPFPAGEAAISKDAAYSFCYARYILKGPFPAGEATIAKDAAYAYEYAFRILKAPFPTGEKVILASYHREEYLKEYFGQTVS